MLPTQVLSVELPRDVLDDLEAGTVSASAYVNVVMNSTQNFFVKVTDLQASGSTAEETKDMQITADVEKTISQPSYTVTVPSAVSMGTLSAEKDNVYVYAVDVEAEDLTGNYPSPLREREVLPAENRPWPLPTVSARRRFLRILREAN